MQVPQLLLLCVLVVVAQASLVVQEPLNGKRGDEKLLVIVNGAFIENVNYEDVGRSIQEASDLKLWVAIPSFIANCPNPGEIGSKIRGAVSTVQQNVTSLEPSTDVLVAGHSLGGIFSQGVVKDGGYAGLILFGSYLTTGNSLETFKYPVLTLAGELDGLTRITRIAREWRGMQARIAADGSDAAYKFPVIALPGQSHSQFCSNVNVTSFGTKDLMASVSWDTAHAAIGEAVSSFFDLVFSNQEDWSARRYFDRQMSYTQDLIAGFLEAQDNEFAACAKAQQLNTANVSTAFEVTTRNTSNFASFDSNYPRVDTDSKSVSVVVELQHPANPADNSLTDEAATEVDCKMLTEAHILEAFGETATVGTQGCEAYNEYALQQADSLVTSATLDRYQAEGRPFEIQADSVYHTGATWQLGGFKFKATESSIEVQSPLLNDSPYLLCKLLPASRVIETMMVDGLPRFDGTYQ